MSRSIRRRTGVFPAVRVPWGGLRPARHALRFRQRQARSTGHEEIQRGDMTRVRATFPLVVSAVAAVVVFPSFPSARS